MPISPEEAAERLKQLGKKPTHTDSEKREFFLKGLGIDSIKDKEFHRTVGKTFRELDLAQRSRFFVSMSGQLKAAGAKAIAKVNERPYQSGLYRHPFRAALMPVREVQIGGILSDIYELCARYDQPPEFFAEWVAYIDPKATRFGLDAILAGAIDAGDEKTLDILIRSLEGEHPIGAVSRAGIRALLGANNEQGWHAVERLVLNAEREEGLRQTVFESVDELNPQVFPRFLRLIVEHDLLRFSSVQRAFCTSMPFAWRDSSGYSALNRILDFFADRTLEPNPSEPLDIHLALWTDAFLDAAAAIKRADNYVESENEEVRKAVADFLYTARLSNSFPALSRLIGDSSPRVAATAYHGIDHFNSATLVRANLEPVIRAATAAWPIPDKDYPSKDLVWDLAFKATPENETSNYAPFLKEFSAKGRVAMAKRLLSIPDSAQRIGVAIELFRDIDSDVRTTARKYLETVSLEARDATLIEDMLKRKSSDARRAAISLLSKQEASLAKASADRLLACKDPLQRAAGQEILKEIGLASATESSAGANEDSPLTYMDGLGLFDPEELTYYPKPASSGVPVQTAAATQCLRSLDDFVDDNRNLEVSYVPWWPEGAENRPSVTALLFTLRSRSIRPNTKLLYEDDRVNLPFADRLERWMDDRPSALRDSDGQELVRAWVLLIAGMPRRGGLSLRLTEASKEEAWVAELRHLEVIELSMTWLLHRVASQINPDVLIDMIAQTIAETSGPDEEKPDSDSSFGWRVRARLSVLVEFLQSRLAQGSLTLSPDQAGRIYRILRYCDEPCGAIGRPELVARAETAAETGNSVRGMQKSARESLEKPKGAWIPRRLMFPFEVVDWAYRSGACSKAEAFDYLMFLNLAGPWNSKLGFREVTKPRNFTRLSEAFQEVVREFLSHLIGIESKRGELPTLATPILSESFAQVRLDDTRKLLRANVALTSRSTGSSDGRAEIFRRLLLSSYPGLSESPEEIAEAFEKDGIKFERLIELAMLAPQWASAVELRSGIHGLADGIWWILAHAKDDHWHVEPEIREVWAGELSERTPISTEQFENGSVDVAWFRRMRSILSDKDWATVMKNAKFTCEGSGHVRAQLFANAMEGKVSVDELSKRMLEKRHGDSARALGLVPLAADAETDISSRYATLMEFQRTSRQFGAARQASEKLAVQIGLENLAGTAGYPDPLRLIWALEAKMVEDLVGEGKTVFDGDVTVRLYFDAFGDPQLETTKAGKRLADIPATTKKNNAVKELSTRRTDLRKQAQRMRRSLEESMQRGDEFLPSELEKLMEHPGLAPMLRNLLFLGSSGEAGFLDDVGRLSDGSTTLRLAHPCDLLQRGDWPAWQSAVFREERVQPFKQVFRELYVLTESEKEADRSTRYAGHQLKSLQTAGILGKRGWVIRPEEGISRTNYETGITAHLEFQENFYTPADMEGLTFEALVFTRAKDWRPIPLRDVPPKLFSETMRDMDLIVSVASMVGVDPEASESTVEMRARVVRETAALLRLENIRFTDRHVWVGGKLAEYSVHLGSGTVHQVARGMLVIIAVRQPQRGRLFLPFVDDDPVTAEIVSKVLMLARDDQITDPTILSQIVSVPLKNFT